MTLCVAELNAFPYKFPRRAWELEKVASLWAPLYIPLKVVYTFEYLLKISGRVHSKHHGCHKSFVPANGALNAPYIKYVSTLKPRGRSKKALAFF